MTKQEYKVIGVMSGTSLDGLDLAYINLLKNNHWKFEIEIAETYPYAQKWVNILKDLVNMSPSELSQIDEAYSIYMANLIKKFIQLNSIENIDAICVHGHTALHQPDKGITYQIGNQDNLAKILKNTIVCDFRIQDVKLGGQGAPLVPIGDELLFPEFDYCINLGGFANVSTKINNQRIAYDICPVNIVLNYYAKKLGVSFDDKGKIASKGIINNELFDKLNRLSFYKQSYPKSLGLEWVQSQMIPIIESQKIKINNILRTFVEHIAIQIVSEINAKGSTVLFSGGGVYNLFLMERIKTLSDCKIVIPSKEIIDYKEALIFGLLGVLKLRNEVNCLSSVTGAKNDHSSGVLFVP